MPAYTITYDSDEGPQKKSISGQPTPTAAKTEFIRQMLIERRGLGTDVGGGVGLHPMPKGMEFPPSSDFEDDKSREARLIAVAKEVWPKLKIAVRDPDKPFPESLAAELKKLHEESQPKIKRDAPAPATPNVQP